MPNVRKTRTRRARKGSKPRRRVYRPRYSMRKKRYGYSLRPAARLTNGFPNTYTCKLRYHRNIILNPGVDTPDVYILLANGLFAPDSVMGAPAGAHQPYQFDQLMAQYVYAYVVGSKCSVRWTPASNAAITLPSYVQVTCSKTQFSSGTFSGPGGVSDYSHWIESQAGRKVQMGAQAYPFKSDGPLTSTAKYSPRITWNITPRQLLSYPLHANDITSNPDPSTWTYFNIVAMAPDTTTDPASITLSVLVEYTVKFTGKKILPIS